MHLKSVILATALSGCAWKGAPPVIKVANAVGWAAMPAGVAVALTAPDSCRTDPTIPGFMECGRSSERVALGLGLVLVGFFAVMFTHYGLQ